MESAGVILDGKDEETGSEVWMGVRWDEERGDEVY